MKVKFEIYSCLLDEVTKLSEEISNHMRDFGYDNLSVHLGWRIGEVTVTLPEGKTKQEIKNMLEDEFKSKVTQPLWLKEVAYE